MKTVAIVQTLNTIQALLKWLESRNVIRTEIMVLLDTANNENRDITTSDVQNQLDIVTDELSETEKLLNP